MTDYLKSLVKKLKYATKIQGNIYKILKREDFLIGHLGQKPLKMKSNSGWGKGEALNSFIKVIF